MPLLTKMRLHPLIARIVISVSGDALLALFCYRLDLNLATTSLLFLFAVVAQALGGGVTSSLLASFIAAAFLDYFFVPPVLTWRIANPFDAVALLAFITTSLVIANLASKTRAEAKRAEHRRMSLEQLYQASQQLLWVDPGADVARTLLKTLREGFGLRAACFFDGTAAETYVEGESPNLADQTREAYVRGVDQDDPGAHVSLRCLRHAGRIVGAIGFENLRSSELTAGPLMTLALATLERARAAQEANRATAEAKAEVFRAAVLDGLAHEFKTPLGVITAAAGGLSAAGPLSPDQQEMADTIEEEAARLGNLTSHLLRKAQIDREQVRPRMKESDVLNLVARVAEKCNHQVTGRRIRVEQECGSAVTIVDEELFCLALTQLLDNAVKYSKPASDIVVTLSCKGALSVRVFNHGSSVPRAERHRIFERFYRGTQGQQVGTGSGLGLYVAKKIAGEHGGSLQIDPDGPEGDGTTFCLTLPLAIDESRHASKTDSSAGCR
jgi:two-component system sensor histidine kinase KdpD